MEGGKKPRKEVMPFFSSYPQRKIVLKLSPKENISLSCTYQGKRAAGGLFQVCEQLCFICSLRPESLIRVQTDQFK